MKKEEKNVREREKSDRRFWISFLERVSSFSLSFRAIRPLAVFGARRKAALRGKAFAWVLDLRSLDKLQEVGVSPYLVYSLFKN